MRQSDIDRLADWEPGEVVRIAYTPSYKYAPMYVTEFDRTNNITLGTFVSPDHLCPDLLRYEQIGAADNLRGRVVRAFFFLMRAWRVP